MEHVIDSVIAATGIHGQSFSETDTAVSFQSSSLHRAASSIEQLLPPRPDVRIPSLRGKGGLPADGLAWKHFTANEKGVDYHGNNAFKKDHREYNTPHRCADITLWRLRRHIRRTTLELPEELVSTSA
jgi:hypothetical protein